MIHVHAAAAKSIRSVMGHSMRVIHKKIWPEYFEAVLAGKKKAEFRLNDFEVEEGDQLILDEWDPQTKQLTGRSVTKIVTHVNRFTMSDLEKFWTREEIEAKGFQMISME